MGNVKFLEFKIGFFYKIGTMIFFQTRRSSTGKLAGRKDSGIPGFKDSSVCFLIILSLAFSILSTFPISLTKFLQAFLLEIAQISG